jgi:hypothetical protein
MTAVLLDQWRWNAGEGEGSWSPPPGCVGAVDLASAAQIAAAKPGQPRGVGIFVCPEIPADWDGAVLASDDIRDAKPTAKILAAWKSLTGYQPAGDSLADCLWDHLTSGADPDNETACGVLMPDARGFSTLWLGTRIVSRAFAIGDATPYAANVRQVLTAQLAAAKAQSRAGKMLSPTTGKADSRFYLKVADALAEKFAGKDPAKKAALLALIKPASFDAGDVLVPHETTLTETWTHADNTGDISADQTWTGLSGTAQIASNAVQIASTSGDICYYRCEADLSSADHACQLDQNTAMTEPTTSRNWAPAARYSGSANTCYHGKQFGGSSGNGICRIAKNITGSMTNLGAGTANCPQDATVKISCSGSSIAIYSNGTLLETITDTAIASGTRGGIFLQGRQASWSVDNWVAEDLAVSSFTPTPYYRLLAGMGNL